MKKFLSFLLCVGMLWACNNAESNEKEQAPGSEEHSSLHEVRQAELALNNGVKWKSDESTNHNVAQLKAITGRFNENKNKSLSDYMAVGSELQTGLDKMIKECRMQGADHDALHLWLEPLMKNVAGLKKAASEQEGSRLVAGINERLDMYTQYFE